MSDRVCLQGFYVLVDFHAAPGDTTVQSGNLVRDWQTLWRVISSRPAFDSALAGRIFLDIINEPDGLGLRYKRRHFFSQSLKVFECEAHTQVCS